MRKPMRYFKDKYISWFLGLCALSVLLHPKTLSAFILLFLGVLLYYLVVSYTKNTKNIKRLLYVIIGISALNTLFAILQFFKINIIYNLWLGSIVGMMFTPSHLGAYQALALPICYAVNPFLAIIPLIGLFLSKSFTPILACFIGIIYLLYPKKEKIFVNLAPMGWIALLGIFIVLIVRNYHNAIYKFTLRLGLWKDVFMDILRQPLGYGLGTFSKITSMGKWEISQNEYLEIAFCIGVLAWFIAGLFLIDKFQGVKVGLERTVAASCLIITVICLGQSPLHFPRLTGTIIPLFAFLEILKRKEGVSLK